MGVTSLRFASAARDLCTAARRLGLVAPGFRSPPRLAGADRSLRRRSGSPPAVAVRLRGRTERQVLLDMVDGVVVANGLTGADADGIRRRLCEAVGLEPVASRPDARRSGSVAAHRGGPVSRGPADDRVRRHGDAAGRAGTAA